LTLFDPMKKRDWAFLAACIAAALLFGVWSFQMGIAYHRAHPGSTDLSSANRRGGNSASVTAPVPPRAGDGDAQTGRAR